MVDAKRCRKIFLAMKRKHSSKIDVRQHIAVKNKKCFFSADERAILRQCSGAAKQLQLLDNADFDTALLRRGKLLDRLRMSMCVDQNVRDARRFTVVEPDFQQRNVLDWQQAFRNAIRQRTQPRAVSRR